MLPIITWQQEQSKNLATIYEVITDELGNVIVNFCSLATNYICEYH